jgi:DNA-binding response OmpR family regulator
MLEGAGYAVTVAHTAAAGLTRLARGDVDLLLLDLILPDMDGLEVCLRVRAQESAVYLPIVMLTAREGDAYRHQGFVAGADDYVTKPFRNQDLLDRVQVWLHTRQRLKLLHARLVYEVERRAHDEAVLAMARVAGEQLRQPLTVLLGHLELWRAGRVAPQDLVQLHGELQGATEDLMERVALLERVVRYETKLIAGVVVLDLDRAGEPASSAPT